MAEQPVDQINFRHTCTVQSAVELHHIISKPSILTHGFMHFPPGCNALVRVRLLIGRKGGQSEKVTPIDDQYVALDASDYEFELGQKVDRNELVILELRNYDTVNSHTITCLVSKQALERSYDQPTEGKKGKGRSPK